MNFGTPVPLLIGIVLILGAVALFFLDKLKPGYGRDSDKVYAILWLISGVFLLGHLTMELLASFQQLLMAGMLIALTIENVLSRTPRQDAYSSVAAGPDGGGRNDYYRPSRSTSYRSDSRMNVRAELDDDAYGNRFPGDRRMLSGRDTPARQPDYYRDDYPERYRDNGGGYPERPEPPAARLDRAEGKLPPSGDRVRRRRPKGYDPRYDSGDDVSWGNEPSNSYAPPAGGYSSHSSPPSSSSYSSSPSYPSSSAYSGKESTGDDSYVDYRPVDYPPSDEKGKPSSDYGSRY